MPAPGGPGRGGRGGRGGPGSPGGPGGPGPHGPNAPAGHGGGSATPAPAKPKKLYDFLPTRRSRKISYALAILALIMSTFVVFGNILGGKIWAVGPFILDAGILVFPLVWTAQDIMVQVFYEKTANHFCVLIACINLLAALLLFFAILLPSAPNVNNPNFKTIFDFSFRVFVASSVGYLARSLVNNHIFDAMRTTTDDRRDIPLRSIVSSLCGRVFDSVLFTLIAFFGRADFFTFLQQTLMSFLAATALEALLSYLVTKPVSLWLIDYLKTN